MIDYIKNIIPRIQQYSQGLNKEEIFVSKTEPWIYVDENGNHHQYIFMRDKRLIMSYNGVVKTGNWERLPTNQLLINRIDDEILLDHIFVEEALLILKLSGSKDLPFILINTEKIPDLNIEKYLSKYEKHNKTKEHIEEQTYRLLESGEIVGPKLYCDKIINTENGVILNGIYQTTNFSGREYCEIINNTIKRVYYNVEYTYENKVIKIEQKEYYRLSDGDKVIEYPSDLLTFNKKIKITYRYIKADSTTYNIPTFTIKINENHKIKIYDDTKYYLLVLFLIIMIIDYLIIAS